MKPLVADDGLRNRSPGVWGTNHFFPCGHARTVENSRLDGRNTRCVLCLRRRQREAKQRRRDQLKGLPC